MKLSLVLIMWLVGHDKVPILGFLWSLNSTIAQCYYKLFEIDRIRFINLCLCVTQW